jgi:hypothetical protein
MQPFSLNQTGTLLPRQLAHFVSAIDNFSVWYGSKVLELKPGMTALL